MKTYLLARIREASTWRGIIFFATAAGVPIAPALAESIVTLGLALAGVVGIFFPDHIGRE